MTGLWQHVIVAVAAAVALTWLIRRAVLRRRAKAGCAACAAQHAGRARHGGQARGGGAGVSSRKE